MTQGSDKETVQPGKIGQLKDHLKTPWQGLRTDLILHPVPWTPTATGHGSGRSGPAE